MNAPTVPADDPVNDDVPYAVASDDSARRKRGLPPWAFPVIGVLVLLTVAGALYFAMIGGKSAAKPVRVMQNQDQPPEPTQTAQSDARANTMAPKRPQNQNSRLSNPLDGPPETVKPPTPPPEMAGARELVALSMQVQAIDAQLQQLVQMLSAQSPMTRKIIAERMRSQDAQTAPASNQRKQRGVT